MKQFLEVWSDNMEKTVCIETVFERLQQQNPHPKSDLIFHSDFELLVAVILSAHSTDKGVNIATHELFKVANTPEKMVALGIERIKPFIMTVGLYNSKANYLFETSKILVEQYKGSVPNQREQLEALPGVGRKTANVVLNISFHQPTLAVDRHIFRVAHRIPLASGNTPLLIEKKLIEIIPERFIQDAHHWLVLHGRYVCTAKKPKCKECCLLDICLYPKKNIPSK